MMASLHLAAALNDTVGESPKLFNSSDKEEKTRKESASGGMPPVPAATKEAMEDIMSYLQEGNIPMAKDTIIVIAGGAKGSQVLLEAMDMAVMQGLAEAAADAFVEVIGDGEHNMSEVMKESMIFLAKELCVTG